MTDNVTAPLEEQEQNPPPLIGGFRIKNWTSPVFSVDKLTIVGRLDNRVRDGVFEWSKSLDLQEQKLTPYPYRWSFMSSTGVYIAFKDPGADIPDFRIEFNPNNHPTCPAIIKDLVNLGSDIRPTRLDLAIDYPVDLSGFHYSTDVPKAGAIWYGRDQKPETFYLGKRSAGSMYRIYNKAKEQKLKDCTWWRIEQEIHLRPGQTWRETEPFSDLHVTKPIQGLNVIDSAVLEYLRAHPQAWSELSKHQRIKYKRMLNQEESTLSLLPAPIDIFKAERWRIDEVLNKYQKLMEGGDR